MIIKHFNGSPKCLSRTVLPALEQGWKDHSSNIHFFFGYPRYSVMKEVNKLKEEWWFIDTGYLSAFYDRNPYPKIHDHDKTYFRVCRGSWHTKSVVDTSPERFNDLVSKNITSEFKGWKHNTKGHVLLCSSDQTDSRLFAGKSVQDWVKDETIKMTVQTGLEVRWRQKPLLSNQWVRKSIIEDLSKDLNNCFFTKGLVSGVMIDALVLGYPSYVHKDHCLAQLKMDPINSILPSEKEVTETLYNLANNQFTIDEMKSGKAYNRLKEYYG